MYTCIERERGSDAYIHMYVYIYIYIYMLYMCVYMCVYIYIYVCPMTWNIYEAHTYAHMLHVPYA